MRLFKVLQRPVIRMEPKRVLLAWEFGAGRTHYSNLLGVARYLRASGIECLAALHENTAADREFAAIGVRTIQNFVWPSQRRNGPAWQEDLVNGFTDFVGFVGLNSSAAVAAAVAHYDALFSLYEPDLVLCEHAFGAMLAAREHIPVVAMGFCVRLPPIVNGGFPLFPGRDTPTIPVDELLASINRGLAVAGKFPLGQIGDLLDIAAVMPAGPEEFDFYPGLRREPLLPPSVPGLRQAFPQQDGNEVFIYLHGFAQNYPAIMDALAALDFPARAYIPDITEASRLKLANIVIEDRPVPVEQIFAGARCIVHQGGEQLTAACLAAGVPQVLISTWLDTRISGGFVKAKNLGDTCRIGDATTAWIVEAIRKCWGDQALRARCKQAAPEFRKWFDVESTSIVAARICQLLGVAFRQPAAPT